MGHEIDRGATGIGPYRIDEFLDDLVLAATVEVILGVLLFLGAEIGHAEQLAVVVALVFEFLVHGANRGSITCHAALNLRVPTDGAIGIAVDKDYRCPYRLAFPAAETPESGPRIKTPGVLDIRRRAFGEREVPALQGARARAQDHADHQPREPAKAFWNYIHACPPRVIWNYNKR